MDPLLALPVGVQKQARRVAWRMWEDLVRRALFVMLNIRNRTRESIADEIELRRLLDMPSSEESD